MKIDSVAIVTGASQTPGQRKNEEKTLQSVWDELGQGLVEILPLRQAGPAQTPARSWIGDRQCVRKVRAPAVMPRIARYG